MRETVVTFGRYIKEHINFVNKHNENGTCKYFSKPCGNGFRREFHWQDGASWYEVVELIGGLWRTEYWSTENFASKVFYEKD